MNFKPRIISDYSGKETWEEYPPGTRIRMEDRSGRGQDLYGVILSTNMANPDRKFKLNGRQLPTYRISWDKCGNETDVEEDIHCEDIHGDGQFFIDDTADKTRVADKVEAATAARNLAERGKAAVKEAAAARPIVKSRFEQAKQLKTHQRKDQLVYIPRRCEVEGCEKANELKDSKLLKCASCSLVMYCCKEHQKKDWPRHKKECKKLKQLGLWGCIFDPAIELARFPLGTQVPGIADFSRVRSESDCCGVCGKSDGPLTITECCGNLICDNEDEYVMFSYSRQFCARSHRRYTTCGAHSSEGHSGDWRNCEDCNKGRGKSKSWYSTNGYNFTPGLEKYYPKGQYITEACSTCNKRIATGFEGHGFSATGVVCMGC